MTETSETWPMRRITLNVNGSEMTAEADDRTLLVTFLRENLRLTGTHVGCDTSQCGACTVHMDGKSVKSCSILAAQAEGSRIVTIEGIAAEGELHPMQQAFRAHHGLQCGYCTPGMIMAAIDLVRRIPDADERTIRENLEGNICRCTGYTGIVRAIASQTRPEQPA